MAACGSDFTVAVTEDGELFAWGEGRHGHLGLGAVLHQQQPARAGGPEMFGNQRIRLAAAGGRHLVVVAEDGAVYTCGLGAYGMLGLGDGQPRRRLTRVPQALFSPKLGQQPAFAIRGTQGPTAGLVTPARRGPTKA